MILLVASNKDIASLNIKEQILNNYEFLKTEDFQENPTYTADVNGKKVTLATLNEESVKAQYLPKDFPNAKLIVFISRHSSQSGKPTLSVHTPGNFGDAELGGLPKTLSVSPAQAMQIALKALMHYKETLNLNYEVSFECTHHGPSLNVPTMFVELGSSCRAMERFEGCRSCCPLCHDCHRQLHSTNQHSGFGNWRNPLQPKVHAYGFSRGSRFRSHDSQICCPPYRLRNVKAVC